MRIYNIVFEVDDYNSLLVKDKNLLKTKLLSMGGLSRKKEWPTSLETVIDNITEPAPNIYCCEATNMLLTNSSLEQLKDALPDNVELLPVNWLGNSGYITNVVGYADCLDTDKTEWLVDDSTGKKLFVDKFAFIKEKVPKNTIFKIKDECFDIFCSESDSSKQGFKNIVEKLNLTGISFELIWED
jgi:hypothetical protein